MKRIAKIFYMMIIIGGLGGCYNEIHPEKIVSSIEIKDIALNETLTPQDRADIIITAHIKKSSYLFNPRTADTPYLFTFSINGNEFKDEVKGVEDVQDDLGSERGKGILYTFKKRLRLKPGNYEVILKLKDGRPSKIKADLKGGKLYTLRFEPVYGYTKSGLPKQFFEGVEYYERYLEENK